jgi:hypothetical protein
VPVVNYQELVKGIERDLSGDLTDVIIQTSTVLEAFSQLNDTEVFKINYKPYLSKGYILYGYPLTRNDLETTLKSNILPDAYLILRTDSNIAAKRIFPKFIANINAKKIQALVRIEEHKRQKELDPFIDDLHDLNNDNRSDQDILIDITSGLEREAAQFVDYISLIDAFASGAVLIHEVLTNQCLRPVLDNVQRKLLPFLEHVWI